MTSTVEHFNRGQIKNGVFRWNSNNHVPFHDMLQDFVEAGLLSAKVAEASNRARSADVDALLDVLLNAPPQHTTEDLYELRAAFGEGETVVNALTGERITL